MLKVYLSNIATSDGIWLAFPLGNKERQEAMKFGAEGTNEIGAVDIQFQFDEVLYMKGKIII